MTLEGAIKFNETNDYTIFTMNSATAGQYCVVLPMNNNGTYNMLVDLHMKSFFDAVNSGIKTKEDLISEISSEYTKVKTKYSDAILVIPMFDEANYVNIINTNDKQKMFDEVKKIGAITSELYKKLISSGIDKQKIDQKIIILEKNDYDKKFVEWLIGQMPNFVSGVAMSEFNTVNANPFMDNNTSSDTNNIFGVPVVEEKTGLSGVNDVVTETIDNNNLNGLVGNDNLVQQPVQEQAIGNVGNVPNIFGEQQLGQSIQQPIQQGVQVPVQQPVQQPVIDNQVIEGPKQVQNVELGNTVSFSPVNDNSVASASVQSTAPDFNVAPVTSNEVDETSAGEVTKKSNGFVNLAILLVVLVVVTIISIELGKFLYNTYGV